MSIEGELNDDEAEELLAELVSSTVSECIYLFVDSRDPVVKKFIEEHLDGRALDWRELDLQTIKEIK